MLVRKFCTQEREGFAFILLFFRSPRSGSQNTSMHNCPPVYYEKVHIFLTWVMQPNFYTILKMPMAQIRGCQDCTGSKRGTRTTYLSKGCKQAEVTCRFPVLLRNVTLRPDRTIYFEIRDICSTDTLKRDLAIWH